MYILGVNLYHGNASAALLCDGRLVAAAEEERFTRVKYAAGFPTRAIQYCLAEGGVTIDDVDHLAIPRRPHAHLAAKMRYALRLPRFAWDRSALLLRTLGLRHELAQHLGVEGERVRATIHRVEHHVAHLASTYFVSPFDQAAVLSIDGLGDFASTRWAIGRGHRLDVGGAITFPHSLGLYYTAITQYLGFHRFGDEYKVMGLAAYGEPAYQETFRQIVQPRAGLAFRLGLEYFLHHRRGPQMAWRDAHATPALGRVFSPYLERRLGRARAPGEPLEPWHRDVAASLQARLEDVLFALLEALHAHTRQTSLCLAGGVAFNCAATGKILDRTPFERLYIQPAAGDAGLALGAACYVYHQILGRPRGFAMDHAYWGPEFSGAAIKAALERRDLRYRQLPEPVLCRQVAEHVAAGRVVGWFQGRMEWGPRALGNRSIVADPRRAEMKDILNRRVKHREPFRPFAPSILEEATGAYFTRSDPSPFMLLAYPVRRERRETIPAPTHVDGTGRLQTVSRRTNPRYWGLIDAFGRLTGVPVVLNTSFNENEPIVCTPDEAIDCYLRSHMDVLAIGDCLVQGPGV